MPVRDRMSEAEVAIRLAEYLLTFPSAADHATVAIDGAVIASADRGRLFEIEEFLSARGWQFGERQGTREWRGSYSRNGKGLSINSVAGTGDVVVQLGNRRVVAECKGGPLVKKHGSQEHRSLKEALGQALLWNGDASDLVIVAVPDTQWFSINRGELAAASACTETRDTDCARERERQRVGFRPASAMNGFRFGSCVTSNAGPHGDA